MAADNPPTVETISTDRGGNAYISPKADFLIVVGLVVVVTAAVGAVILP